MILKKCNVCQKLYPGKLQDPINLCPQHHTPNAVKTILMRFIRARQIGIDNFDVWDSEYPYKNSRYGYERVCRICGKRLLKRDGTWSSSRRQCCSTETILKQWGQTRWRYILHVEKRQQCQIALQYLDQLNDWYYFRRVPSRFICCERCGKLTDKPEVHHIEPVCMLNETNWELVWDYSNLIVLCHKCHAKAPSHQKFRVSTKKVKIEVIHNTLESWL